MKGIYKVIDVDMMMIVENCPINIVLVRNIFGYSTIQYNTVLP